MKYNFYVMLVDCITGENRVDSLVGFHNYRDAKHNARKNGGRDYLLTFREIEKNFDI